MRNLFISLILVSSLASSLPLQASDWRKKAPVKKKVDNLVKVIPGASVLMLQMGQRYRNLYWAAKLRKWEFAAYQLEEMDDLIHMLIITRPARAATARHFLSNGFKPLKQAIRQKNWDAFQAGFEHMRQKCMTCHVANRHGFIKLPRLPRHGNSPVLE